MWVRDLWLLWQDSAVPQMDVPRAADQKERQRWEAEQLRPGSGQEEEQYIIRAIQGKIRDMQGLIFYFLTLDKFSHSTISHFSEPSLRIVWSCQHSLTVTRRLLASTLRYENTKRKIEEKEKINVYGQGSEKDSTSCVICMTDFKPGERVRRLACLHLFHVDCIDHWLTRQR